MTFPEKAKVDFSRLDQSENTPVAELEKQIHQKAVPCQKAGTAFESGARLPFRQKMKMVVWVFVGVIVFTWNHEG